MSQRDKIEREADRIGLALAKLLNLLLHKKELDSNALNTIAEHMQTELEINIPEYLELDSRDDQDYLAKNRQFSLEHFRSFGNLLYSVSNLSADQKMKGQLRNKALSLYEYIKANGNGTLFMDVEFRIKELRS